MTRLLVRILISALAFIFVLPMIHGIDFHGSFMAAIGLAIVFGCMVWLVDLLALMLTAALTISTFGIALLWLIPIWLLGFWLLPAVALKWLADLMPTYLTVAGWVPAVLGGLVMLFVGVITSSSWSNKRTS